MVFVNRILRRIFRRKREWRRLHNEEHHRLYRSFREIKSRLLRRAGRPARMEYVRSAFKILAGKPMEKILLGRPRRRWKKYILEWILTK